MAQNILCAGFEIPTENDNVNYVSLRSKKSLLDADIIVFSPTLSDYQNKYDSIHNGKPPIDDSNSFGLITDLEYWKFGIESACEVGKTVFVFLREIEEVFYHTGERKFSGTGRSIRTTDMVAPCNNYWSIPVNLNLTTPSEGKEMKLTSNASFLAKYWTQFKPYSEYRFYFESADNVIITTKIGRKTVGAAYNIGKGWLILLPFLDLEKDVFVTDNGDELSWTPEAIQLGNQLLSALIDIDSSLSKSDLYVLPKRSHSFLIPTEKEQKISLAQLKSEKEKIENQIIKKEELINEIERIKVLFTGDSSALEEKAREVFDELGFATQSGEVGRDDLILDFKGRPAVVEVKGLSKSAAEKNAAQLEKWVSNYYLAHEIQPKGILLINAHKDLPLSERTINAFPHQMLAYCQQRGHCLITGLQLLGLYLDAKANPAKKDELIESLFNTVGVYQGY